MSHDSGGTGETAGAIHDRHRRSLLVGMSGAAVAALAAFKKAHGMHEGMHAGTSSAAAAAPAKFRKMGPRDGFRSYPGLHEGKGVVGVRYFFKDDGAPRPALLLTYAIPPGASEGVHTHRLGDKKLGSFDEFYYIMAGSGEMEIAGEKVPVSAGDHVFTPNGVPHGIENTAKSGDLMVYLVAMIRE